MKDIYLKINCTYIFFLIAIFQTCVYPQIDSSGSVSDIYSDIIEKTAEENEEESDNYISDLETLRENPVDLNTADIFELQRLPFITADKAEKILEYRIKYGRIFSLNELTHLYGFDSQLIEEIAPFVTIDFSAFKNKPARNNSGNSGGFSTKLRSRVILPLQIKKGFKDNKFTGTRIKNYNRLQINFGKSATVNILSDKDEGEIRINDFNSFNLRINDFYFVKNFIIGDYNIEAGQGLTLWGSYSNSIGTVSSSTNIRNQRNTVPYSSSGEYGFLRGAAGSFSAGNYNLSVFFSRNNIDANIDSSSGIITSFKQDGYHRTAAELIKKDNTRETLTGIVLEYYIKNFLKAGLIYTNTSLDKPLERDYQCPLNKFENYSLYYDLYLKTLKLSGEAAYDKQNIAVINNIYYLISNRISSVISFRYYSPFFGSLHGLGFGEGSKTNNEIGLYTGIYLNYSFGKFLSYFDNYKYLMPAYNALFPSKGWKSGIAFFSRRFSGSEISIRYNISQTESKAAVNNRTIISTQYKNRIRFELKKYYAGFVIKSRIDYNWLSSDQKDTGENGFMISQDIMHSPLDFLKIYGRIIFFRTKSFETAVYEYENDLDGLFKSSSLYGSGIRWYLLLKIIISKNIYLSFKYSETNKPFSRSTGSGNSLIEGDIDNTFGMQLDAGL